MSDERSADQRLNRLRLWRMESPQSMDGLCAWASDELAEFLKLKNYAASLGQRTYLELHAENEQLRGALRGLLPEGWDDGTMDHMPGVKAAREALHVK